MNKFFAILMLVVLLFSVSACSNNVIKGSVIRESAYGDAELDIIPQKVLEKLNIGDTVIVKIGDFEEEMPFVDELIVEDGKLQLVLDRENWNINVSVYNECFFEKYSIEVEDKVEIQKK